MKTLKEDVFFIPPKICGYRNCEKEVLGRRSDAKYCSTKHKNCEKVYRKRLRIKNKIN